MLFVTLRDLRFRARRVGLVTLLVALVLTLNIVRQTSQRKKRLSIMKKVTRRLTETKKTECIVVQVT